MFLFAATEEAEFFPFAGDDDSIPGVEAGDEFTKLLVADTGFDSNFGNRAVAVFAQDKRL